MSFSDLTEAKTSAHCNIVQYILVLYISEQKKQKTNKREDVKKTLAKILESQKMKHSIPYKAFRLEQESFLTLSK